MLYSIIFSKNFLYCLISLLFFFLVCAASSGETANAAQRKKVVNPVFYLDVVEIESVGRITAITGKAYIKKPKESRYADASVGSIVSDEDIIELYPDGKLTIEYRKGDSAKSIELISEDSTKWFAVNIIHDKS